MTAVAAKKPIALTTDVWTLALERTAVTFERFDHVYMAFSGGKDSTAVLNVALEVAHSDPRYERHLPLRAVFFDEECIPYETEQYVRRVSERDDVNVEWYCLPVKHRNACSRKHPFWWPWAPEDEAKWARPLPPDALTQLDGFPIWPVEQRLSIPHANGLVAPPKLGNSAVLMGIRAQESLTRRRAVSLNREINYLVHFTDGTSSTGNNWKSYPIYDWRTEDVWTAPAKFDWDYNSAYDLMEMAGISAAGQRCSPAFGEEPLQKLHIFAQCFPDVWERMAERLPGVGAAARYARTELYGYQGRPEKAAGMLWPEFIRHYIGKHDPKVSANIAARTFEVIRRHYRATTLPLVVKAPNPVTGLSWNFLLMLVMRGDFKERKQPAHSLSRDPEVTRKLWRRYAEELAEILEAGTFADLAYPGRPPRDPYALIPVDLRETAP